MKHLIPIYLFLVFLISCHPSVSVPAELQDAGTDAADSGSISIPATLQDAGGE